MGSPVGSGHEARDPEGIRFMASIDKRGKPGRHTWRVKWRVGGTREARWDGETCDDLKTARHFKALVEAAGEQRPAGYPKGCRGHRVADVASEALAIEPVNPTSAPAPPSTAGGGRPSRTFGQVVEEYLRQLKRAERRQVADYRRRWRQHVESAVVNG
jgi:hypothetical protein